MGVQSLIKGKQEENPLFNPTLGVHSDVGRKVVYSVYEAIGQVPETKARRLLNSQEKTSTHIPSPFSSPLFNPHSRSRYLFSLWLLPCMFSVSSAQEKTIKPA